ncbi:MAG: GDP-mannose 4,6-dehydratase [Candidatus Woesearchaeota archaeon]
MKILVTGGAGFIGSHLCDALVERGDTVICVDNFDEFYDLKIKERNISGLLKKKNFILYRNSILENEIMDEIFFKQKPEIVVHLAAKVGVRNSIKKPNSYVLNNVVGTTNLLSLSVKHNIKNFIMASSSSVYGESSSVPFKEHDHVAFPLSPYAATKRSAELIAHSFSKMYNLSIICLRFFTVYGPRGRPDMAPYKFLYSIHNNKEIEVYGDGKSYRDYTYIYDVIRAILKCTEQKFSYEIINIGNSNPIPLNGFISIIEKVTRKKAKIKRLPLQPGDVTKTYADITKAKTLLNWKPTTDIEKGLKETFKYLKEI